MSHRVRHVLGEVTKSGGCTLCPGFVQDLPSTCLFFVKYDSLQNVFNLQISRCLPDAEFGISFGKICRNADAKGVIMPSSTIPNLGQNPDMAANPAKSAAAAIFTVSQARFSCDGGGGALGHPKIYLDLSHSGRVDCPYCGRRFAFSGKHDE